MKVIRALECFYTPSTHGTLSDLIAERSTYGCGNKPRWFGYPTVTSDRIMSCRVALSEEVPFKAANRPEKSDASTSPAIARMPSTEQARCRLDRGYHPGTGPLGRASVRPQKSSLRSQRCHTSDQQKAVREVAKRYSEIRIIRDSE